MAEAYGTYLNSANFTGYNGNYFYSQLRYEIIKKDVANNKTTVRYHLYTGSSGGSAWGANGTGKILGSTVGTVYPIAQNSYNYIGYLDTTYTHNNDGTKTVSYNSTIETPWDGVNNSYISGTLTLPKIDRYPMLTSAPNFNDEENPKITYTKVLEFQGATVQAGITSQDKSTIYVPYRNITVDDGEYTFNLTNQERQTLRNATPNSNTLNVQFRIKTTTTNNVVYYSDLEKAMTIVNANPTFTYTTEEQNANVVSMLGSNAGTTLVANVSELEFTYTPTTYKGATTKQFNVSEGIVGTTYQSYTLTTSPYVQTFDVTGTTYSGKFVHTLIDSRNNQTTIEDNQRTLLDYDIVRINSYNFKRQSQTSSNIIFNGEFSYWGNIGSHTNTPVVKYKLDDGSWVTIPSSNYSINTTTHKLTITNYTISNIIPYTSQGQFSLSINDILTSKVDTSVNGRVLRGIPTFDYGEHDLKVNGHLYIADENGQNPQEVLPGGDSVPINSIFEYSGSTVPEGYELVEEYSTTEIKTNKVWKDGKSIYRKCVTGTMPNGTTTIITGASEIIDHHIMVKRSGVEQYHPLSPTMDNYDSNHAYPLFISGTNINLFITNSSYTGQSYYGWIEYTKSS